MDGQTSCYCGLSSRNDTILAPGLPSSLSNLYRMSNSTGFGKCRWATAETGEAEGQREASCSRFFSASSAQPIQFYVHGLTTHTERICLHLSLLFGNMEDHVVGKVGLSKIVTWG